MITLCPHLDCGNRTEFGYCKTTACINPMHSNLGTAQYGQGVQRNIITNADSIRSMTDEMLSYYIAMFMECDECILRDVGNCVDVITCQNAWLDWLKQEATE